MHHYTNGKHNIHEDVYNRLKRIVIYDDDFNEILRSNLYDTTRVICDLLPPNERGFINAYYNKQLNMEEVAAAIKRSLTFVYSEQDRLIEKICTEIIVKTVGIKDSYDIACLGLPNSIKRRLYYNGYNIISKIANLNQRDLYSIDGFGMSKINKIIDALDNAGIQHNLTKLSYKDQGKGFLYRTLKYR